MKNRTRTIATTPKTHTQRGVLVSDAPSGAIPVSPFVLGSRGGSAMSLPSFAHGHLPIFELIGFCEARCLSSRQDVSQSASCILPAMPRLWDDTIEAHRREVGEAIMDTTAALVAEHGLQSVTMSQIAEETGIGRATLYKYFSDVEAILVAWHERQIRGHLEHLVAIRDHAGGAGERLEAVLEAYALISYEHHRTELAALLHRGDHFARAQQQLRDLIQGLLAEAARTGHVREDVAPSELASYCLHALAAASSLRSRAAVRRLVAVTLSGLRRRG